VTFNGRGAMGELLRRGRWSTLVREIRAMARQGNVSARTLILAELLYPLLPGRPLQLARRAFGRKAVPGNLTASALTAETRRTLGDREALVVADGRETRWRLITSPHIAHRAENWAQIGARHGLAFAFPLLDRRVVEFALSLPSEFFLREGVRRRVFRDAMRGILPESIRTRADKRAPFPGWLIDIADSRDAVEARLQKYAADRDIAETLDFAVLRDFAAHCPSSEHARIEAAGGDVEVEAGRVVALIQALSLANYLSQHDRPAKHDATRSVVDDG